LVEARKRRAKPKGRPTNPKASKPRVIEQEAHSTNRRIKVEGSRPAELRDIPKEEASFSSSTDCTAK
jgi:hypothetical protein